jgi:alpha-galactosidase
MKCFLILFLGGVSQLFAQPIFQGAEIIGIYPNSFFLHTIAAAGNGPITFSAHYLPETLTLDTSTGIISGIAPDKGNYRVQISATDKNGTSTKTLEIVVGDKLALTPPMGWNSWNVFAHEVNEKLIMEIADAMVNSGMRNAGYTYINIDDFWHADQREADGKPKADEKKFPNGMKYLADYVHSKGLKLGIYSCAGKYTCGERFGSYGYEDIDAQTYAEWGIDLLKYDYCYAPWSKKAAIKRYTKMGEALKKTGRSIVFSVCEWGLRKPWKWAAKAGGTYWRTTPDIFDKWSGNHLWQYSTMQILRHQRGLEKYASPGEWNDPDMLTVGNYGKGIATSARGKYTGMTNTEYESQFAIWCMLSAPLLASCDLRQMNNATKNILLNSRLIALNQDVAGKQASLAGRKNGIWIYRKPLSDGVAFAFLNTHSTSKSFVIPSSVQQEIQGKKVEGLLNAPQVFDVHSPLFLEKHQTMVIKISP